MKKNFKSRFKCESCKTKNNHTALATGPIGDCSIQSYDKRRYVTRKQYIKSEWRPDVYYVGDIPIPIVTEVKICFIEWDEYWTPKYRCVYQGKVTYTKGSEVKVGHYSSGDLPCNDLADVDYH